MSDHHLQPSSEQPLVVIEETVPLADSRAIARQLGIEHRSFFRMVLTYQHEIEADFGILRFQIAKPSPGSVGGRPEKYTLLTEDQTYAYMSYSQNTAQARACKRLLVKAFAEARRCLGQPKEQHREPVINSLWENRLISLKTIILGNSTKPKKPEQVDGKDGNLDLLALGLLR